MKTIKTRMLALLLSCCLVVTGTVGGYRQVQAAEVVAGMETIQFIISLGATLGISFGICDLLGETKEDTSGWTDQDYWDAWHQPASQKEIDELDEKINEYYNNAVKWWIKVHNWKPSVSPEPSQTPMPPATVEPSDPDGPIDYDTLKKNTADKGTLTLIGASLVCMKKAISDLWNDIVHPVDVDNEELPDDVKEMIKTSGYPYYIYITYKQGGPVFVLGSTGSYMVDKGSYVSYSVKGPALYYSKGELNSDFNDGLSSSTMSAVSYVSNMPKFASSTEAKAWRDEQIKKKKIPKAAIWPSLGAKKAYDNNSPLGDSSGDTSGDGSGSPSGGASGSSNPFNFILPTIKEIIELMKQGQEDEANKSTYVSNFITNHTVQTTPAPEPTTAPDPGGSGGTTPDPDTPDEDNIDGYKADLRLVFPFCIPFDLVHLLEALDAEPEAPVFKIPVDLTADNPFSGDSIVDYHDEMVIDLSDYDDVIKVIRILEIIAFIIVLMLITRQHMIKG